MERADIIKELGKFFKVEELVCPHIYKKFKDNSWRFLDTDYLHSLLILRKNIFQAPMTCNTKAMTQRGMRCNCCDLIKHFLVAFVIGLVATAFSLDLWFVGVVVAYAIFIGKEIYDCFKPNPSGFDWLDLLADTIGYVLASGIIYLIVFIGN